MAGIPELFAKVTCFAEMIEKVKEGEFNDL